MKNKKKNRIMLLLILILGVTIGFALLSTTLFINGTASIKSNTWNIHWDDESINVTEGSVSATDPAVSTTTSTKDTVSFDVELELPGDFYEFEIDAINEGSVDGALDLATNWITYKVNSVETTLPEYMDFKVVYDDDTTPVSGNVLKASESQTYKIRVEFKSGVEELPEDPKPINIEVELPYIQHKEECTAPVSFSEDSWETIACNVRKGNTSAYNVGDTKTVSIYGTKTVRIANKSTPNECKQAGFSQTACGFVVEFQDVISGYIMNPEANPQGVIESNNTINGVKSKGGWEYSMMRDYINNDIFSYLPSDLKSVIVDTTVVSSHNDQDTDNFTTTDKLYLLATHEIWTDDDGDTNIGLDKYDSAYNNTRQLDYYASKGVVTNNGTTHSWANKNGNPDSWWLRSAYGDSSTSFYYVGYGGAPNNRPSVSSLGIAPAFKIG